MANWFDPAPEVLESYAKWVAERPEIVREVISKYDFAPWKLYRLHSEEGKPLQRVFIHSFGETDDPAEPVTLTVVVSAQFNAVAMERRVFGIKPDRLQECDLPSIGDPVGSAGLTPEQTLLPDEEVQRLLRERATRFRRFGDALDGRGKKGPIA